MRVHIERIVCSLVGTAIHRINRTLASYFVVLKLGKIEVEEMVRLAKKRRLHGVAL